MKHLFLKVMMTAILTTSLIGCGKEEASEHQWKADTTYQLTVLHTNDHHGRFWHNRYGEYGMAARKTLVDTIRKEVTEKGGSVLLFSGGDINTGVPESDLLNAEPDWKGMNKIGYDAAAIGNHEFDNPLDVFEQQIQWANFPVLSANIYDKKTGKRKYQAYQLFEKQGISIAVIGLTTEDTVRIGNPEYVKDLEFRDTKTEIQNVIATLEKTEKPDLIFAITHMGHYANANFGSNAPGDVTLARRLDKGKLDMIIGGHSQDPVCMRSENVLNKNFEAGDACQPDQQNGTWIVQAHEWGKYVGRADFEFRNGVLKLVRYNLIPVNLKKEREVNGENKKVFIQDEIKKDPELLAFLKPYQEKGEEKLGVKIASTSGKLEGDRKVVRSQQTNLGNLIATAHMERTQADFGIMNSGGVRASIKAGDITYKDVLTVQPFGNIISYVDMSGAEIIDYLNVVALKKPGSGAYPQFAGITMVVSNNKVSDVMIGGKPLELDKSYRFSIPGFNAAGGDGYPKISDHAGYVNTGFVDAEVLKEYMESKGLINVNSIPAVDNIIYQ